MDTSGNEELKISVRSFIASISVIAALMVICYILSLTLPAGEYARTVNEAGNTVIVIEHNLDVIKVADHIIDLGPEGGDAGGELVFAGTPEDCAACEASFTGQYLKRVLRPGYPETGK